MPHKIKLVYNNMSDEGRSDHDISTVLKCHTQGDELNIYCIRLDVLVIFLQHYSYKSYIIQRKDIFIKVQPDACWDCPLLCHKYFVFAYILFLYIAHISATQRITCWEHFCGVARISAHACGGRTRN